MTEEQIKHMANRFLGWPIPTTISPDGGLSFERVRNAGTPYKYVNKPVGSNFLGYTEAEQMVRFMLEGLPEGEHVHRDAGTGQFITEAEAKAHPGTTVRDEIG